MIRSIAEIERSNERPDLTELPLPRWRAGQDETALVVLCAAALDVVDVELAERYFLELVALTYRHEAMIGKLRTYQMIVHDLRQEIAWRGLSRDMSSNRADWNPKALKWSREAGRLYGAFLPEQCGIFRPALDPIARDLMERMTVKDETISEAEARRQAERTRKMKRIDFAKDARSKQQQTIFELPEAA